MKHPISHIKSVNKRYNIFTSLRNPNAKPAISSIDQSYLPLGGLTHALKDNIATREEPTTCSSRMLASYISPFDSTVATLLEQSGSTCIGKTNMDEFGMGNSTTPRYFGPTLHPGYKQNEDLFEEYEDVTFDTVDTVDDVNGEVISSDIIHAGGKPTLNVGEVVTKHTYSVPKLKRSENGDVLFRNIDAQQRVVGGSSGGSVAAVMRGLVDFSLGTDTGGSVRLPACYTGIYGFKPTYGRISRWGVIAYAQSLDTVGIMGKDVDTIWRVFSSLDLTDKKDPTCLSDAVREEIAIERLMSKKNVGKKFKVGIPEEFKFAELSEEVKEAWIKLLVKLQESKLIEVHPVSIPSIKHSLPAYYTLATSEASSNLARYDGNRYGFRTDDYDGKEAEFRYNRDIAFGDEVKNRILLGTYALSSYGYDNNYKKASTVRSLLVEEFNKVFRDKHCLTTKKTFANASGIDMLIVPTSVSAPTLMSEFKSTNAVETYMNDVCTIPMSLAGLPSMNIPFENCGFQVVAQHGQDYKVLELSRLIAAEVEK